MDHHRAQLAEALFALGLELDGCTWYAGEAGDPDVRRALGSFDDAVRWLLDCGRAQDIDAALAAVRVAA